MLPGQTTPCFQSLAVLVLLLLVLVFGVETRPLLETLLSNNAPSLRKNTVDSVSQNSGSAKNSNSRKSSSSSVKSSNSGSQLNETITTKEKEEILNIYRNLDEEKLWRPSTGKIVEKKMIKLVEKSIYEHPTHSFILDPDDESWTDCFTEEELNEIRTQKSRELPILPIELLDFLNRIKQMVNRLKHCCL